MLFKALIERLLGSDEAQDWKERERAKSSRFSYDSFPSLPKILLDLLDPNGPLKQSLENGVDGGSPLDLHGAEGVFPALQILRQARPPQPYLDLIKISVTTLFSSPHWHLREMAARTFVSLCSINELHATASSMLGKFPQHHTEQHGVLLTVKFMFATLLRDPALFGMFFPVHYIIQLVVLTEFRLTKVGRPHDRSEWSCCSLVY